MNLLFYTEKKKKKINAFDKIAQNPYLTKSPQNPFCKPHNVTIIWVEKKKNKSD